MKKPTVAVYKFSSCDGCQLTILNLEDELLEVASIVEFAHFLEARRRVLPGPYDIALVEGSVTTQREAEHIKEIRNQVKTLVAIGTCATAGGIQALRNYTTIEDLALASYEHPEFLNTLPKSTPFSEHVRVDYELWGCPPNKYQLLEVIRALVKKRRPILPSHCVCLECKRRGIACVIVAQGIPCLGPSTRTGCGALCPSKNRGCYGCFGPASNMDIKTVVNALLPVERYPGEIRGLFTHISNSATPFRQAVEMLAETSNLTEGGMK